MSTILLPGLPPLFGKYALEAGFRNGIVPPGPHLTAMVHYANHILAQRCKILGRFVTGPSTGTTTTYPDAYDSSAAVTTWYLRFHTSPAASAVVARHILIPTDAPATGGGGPTAPNSLGYWTTTPDGGGDTVQASMYQTTRVTAASNIVPDQWGGIVDQIWSTISADTSYQAKLTVQDQFRPIGCVIFEVPRIALNTATDTYAVDLSKFHAGAPIYDRDTADLLATLTRMWKRGGSNFFNWGCPSTTAARGGLTTTTATNILDGTTGAWAADSAGFQCDPQFHGSIETYNSGTNRETVPVHCWAVFKSSSGAQTATVVFRDQNATIATLTTTSTTAAYVTSSTTWVAPSNATMKMDVMASCSGGATVSLYACGMYQYEA